MLYLNVKTFVGLGVLLTWLGYTTNSKTLVRSYHEMIARLKSFLKQQTSLKRCLLPLSLGGNGEDEERAEEHIKNWRFFLDLQLQKDCSALIGFQSLERRRHCKFFACYRRRCGE